MKHEHRCMNVRLELIKNMIGNQPDTDQIIAEIDFNYDT